MYSKWDHILQLLAEAETMIRASRSLLKALQKSANAPMLKSRTKAGDAVSSPVLRYAKGVCPPPIRG